MSNTNTGGPAFPHTEANGANSGDVGMTLREYAAIKLKVPNSGTDWLDDMIRKSLKDDFAGTAMQASRARHSEYKSWDDLAKDAYEIADAMLKAREA
jgi:hypothetical protein